MSTLHERVEGLVAKWRMEADHSMSSEIRELHLTAASQQVCADEFAAALAADGQGDAPTVAQKLQEVVNKWLAEAERLHNLTPDERERDSRRNGLLEAVADIIAFTAEHGCGAAAPSLHKEGRANELGSSGAPASKADAKDGIDSGQIHTHVDRDSCRQQGVDDPKLSLCPIHGTAVQATSVRYCGHEAPIGKPCPECYPAAPAALHKEGLEVASRSQQKRIAALKGEPAPTFAGKEGAGGDERRLREALELYLRTYADTQTHPTVVEEANCINVVRSALNASPAGRAEQEQK